MSGRSRRCARRCCAALVEITARREGERVRLLLHWKGGDHSELAVWRNKTEQHRWSTDKETVEPVRELARSLSDAGIAGLLNRLGRKTAKGHSWTRARVRSLRKSYGIAAYRPGEREGRRAGAGGSGAAADGFLNVRDLLAGQAVAEEGGGLEVPDQRVQGMRSSTADLAREQLVSQHALPENFNKSVTH